MSQSVGSWGGGGGGVRWAGGRAGGGYILTQLPLYRCTHQAGVSWVDIDPGGAHLLDGIGHPEGSFMGGGCHDRIQPVLHADADVAQARSRICLSSGMRCPDLLQDLDPGLFDLLFDLLQLLQDDGHHGCIDGRHIQISVVSLLPLATRAINQPISNEPPRVSSVTLRKFSEATKPACLSYSGIEYEVGLLHGGSAAALKEQAEYIAVRPVQEGKSCPHGFGCQHQAPGLPGMNIHSKLYTHHRI